MLWLKRQLEDVRLKRAMLPPGPALAAIRPEAIDWHPKRHACLTTVAIRAVSEHAAAPKTLCDEFRISVVVNQMARRGNLRARLLARQIAARVGGSCVKLQRVQRQVF